MPLTCCSYLEARFPSFTCDAQSYKMIFIATTLYAEIPMPKSHSAPKQLADEELSPAEYNPFDAIEFLPGLGIAVLSVVLALVLVNLLLLPVHP